MTWFQLIIKGYSNTTLKYYKQIQTKAGVDIGTEVAIRNYTGDGYDTQTNSVTNPFSTRRFLYAVEESEYWDIYIDIYVQSL